MKNDRTSNILFYKFKVLVLLKLIYLTKSSYVRLTVSTSIFVRYPKNYFVEPWRTYRLTNLDYHITTCRYFSLIFYWIELKPNKIYAWHKSNNSISSASSFFTYFIVSYARAKTLKILRWNNLYLHIYLLLAEKELALELLLINYLCVFFGFFGIQFWFLY